MILRGWFQDEFGNVFSITDTSVQYFDTTLDCMLLSPMSPEEFVAWMKEHRSEVDLFQLIVGEKVNFDA